MSEIMTVPEVASYLKVKSVTIYKLAKQGKMPVFKVGRYLRFEKDLIDQWIKEKIKTEEKTNGKERSKEEGTKENN
jgi:putative molybdopterin biosynthesis protein